MTVKQAMKLWTLATQEQAVAVTPEGEVISNMSPFTSALYYLDVPLQLNYNSDIKTAVQFLRDWADTLEQVKT